MVQSEERSGSMDAEEEFARLCWRYVVAVWRTTFAFDTNIGKEGLPQYSNRLSTEKELPE